MPARLLAAMLYVFTLSISTMAAQSATSPLARFKVPPQLNVLGFSSCLAKVQGTLSLKKMQKRYRFHNFDLLLPYLAVYAGKRMPGFDQALQTPAQNRWSQAFEAREEALAYQLLEFSLHSAEPLTPAKIFELALSTCGKEDGFCAALIAHNVLRTLGRHSTAHYKNPITGETFDYNPRWFRENTAFWLQNAPLIQTQLFSLRRDRGGDGWGSWYHFFGLFTFGIHEMALHGRAGSAYFVARMNRLLNPILASGKENPHQAKMDEESITVTKLFVSTIPDSNLDCSKPESYRW